MLVARLEGASVSRISRVPLYVRHWACVIGLAFADAASFGLAAFLFRISRAEPRIYIGDGLVHGGASVPVDVYLVLAILFIAYRAVEGDYSRRAPFWDGVPAIAGALFVTALPDVLACTLRYPRYSLYGSLCSWLFLMLAVPMVREGARVVLARLGLWARNTALIGSGSAAEAAYSVLNNSLSMGFGVQWLVLTETVEVDVPASLSKLKLIVSPNANDIGQLVQAAGCDQAIVALAEDQQSLAMKIIQRLSEAAIETAIVPPMQRLPMGNVSTSVLFGKNIILFQTRNNMARWPLRTLKRSFDIVGSFVGLVLLTPLFCWLALLIKRGDPGPIFYAQTRIGRDGVPFRCLKFRTMAVDADERLERWRDENPELYEEYLHTFKLRNDPRITPLGDWLRRTSLDELPQLVNILRGEMSFVGPRPVVERELVEFYGPASTLYMRVRPGLTGLWQVSGRSDTTYAERIAFDEWYILNWSFWYDLVIIAQTARAVVTKRGAF